MTRRPVVSVFMMCKDRVGLIRRAVESVLGQTWPPGQFVVQDGASRDGTLSVLREYSSRLDLISEPDGGAGPAFWTAFRRCRGDYIGSCLSDEFLRPDTLELGARYLFAHPADGAVTRDTLITTPTGAVVGRHISEAFALEDFFLHRVTPHFVSVMFRRTAVEQAGLHTVDWDNDCGEFELFCRLMLHWRVGYLPGFAAEYGWHEQQLSRRPDNVVRMAKARARVIDRLLSERHAALGDAERYRDVVVANALQFCLHLREIDASRQAVQLYAWLASLAPGRRREDEADAEAWCPQPRTAGGRPQERDLVLRALTDAGHGVALAVSQLSGRLGHSDFAADLLRLRYRADEDDVDARWELGLLLEARGLIDEALHAWDHDELTATPGRREHVLNASMKAPSETGASLLERHRTAASCRVTVPPPTHVGRREVRAAARRLRIGYLCAFWSTPTAQAQLLPVLRRHDRHRVEVFAYGDQLDPKVLGAVDVFRLVAGLSDSEFVDLARADDLDVLVETTGFSPGHRLWALADRCARVQVSYLNYACTTGVPNVDYVIGDEIATPPHFDEHFTERVARLPRCFFAFDYTDLSAPHVSPPPCDHEGVVTYGCFASGAKISHPLVRRWAEILHRVPDSRLFLQSHDLTSDDNRRFMERRFASHGITHDRLWLEPGACRELVLANYAHVDVALDTFPYNGGNTIAEALWQGVPVVGLLGARFASSYGASLITAAGCPELVAMTEARYVDLAVELAAAPTRLAQYRWTLRDRCLAHGLADSASLAAALEDAYAAMMETA